MSKHMKTIHVYLMEIDEYILDFLEGKQSVCMLKLKQLLLKQRYTPRYIIRNLIYFHMVQVPYLMFYRIIHILK